MAGAEPSHRHQLHRLVIDAQTIEAINAIVNADDGAKISVCVTGTVTGNAKNGADVTVVCGGDLGGMETSDGGIVSFTP